MEDHDPVERLDLPDDCPCERAVITTTYRTTGGTVTRHHEELRPVEGCPHHEGH